MQTVTVSPKYQVVIPKEIRDALGLRPGQKMNDGLQAVAAMQKGKVVDLTANISLNAAKLSLQHNLPMADSIILATAQAYGCLI